MLSYLIVLIYLIGFFPSWRSYAIGLIDGVASSLYGPNNGDRAVGAFVGFLMALAWPVGIPVRFLFRLIVSKGLLKTPNELVQEEKAELEAYRKLAAEHGLPAPTLEE